MFGSLGVAVLLAPVNLYLLRHNTVSALFLLAFADNGEGLMHFATSFGHREVLVFGNARQLLDLLHLDDLQSGGNLHID